MTITVQVEIDNREIKYFTEIIEYAYRTALAVGRKIVLEYLQHADRELKERRDKKRYRSKGRRKTSLKTILGVIEYEREVYEDRASPEAMRYVYLLDEELKPKTIGQVSEEICRYAANSICESTYRDTSRQISEITGMSISPQGVWNIVQAMGERQLECVERHTELAGENQALGELESRVLYEENDGVWLKLQGKDRETYGASKEMKVGIAYDGVRYKQVGKKIRRTLADKVAYASFEQAKQFRKHKDGLVQSRYNTDETEIRVINGDGAQWIFGPTKNRIAVLDKFHRNKMLRACVRDEKFLHLCMEMLYDGKIDELLSCIEAQRDSVEEEKEREDLEALLSYYRANKTALRDYYSRGIPIPETRAPGELHHARLGSMESNVFTLIGNRMKGRRACWSIRGANHLAILLCARHTVGFEQLFAELPKTPVLNVEEDCGEILPASRLPERVGHGYAFPGNVSIPVREKWLTLLSRSCLSFTEMDCL